MSKNGFTLPELLTVVLMVGVSAAVGANEYRKAAEWSRAAER